MAVKEMTMPFPKGTPWAEANMENVINGMRHAVRCPFLCTRDPKDCDCNPLDDSKGMTHADVLRIFAPLPQ